VIYRDAPAAPPSIVSRLNPLANFLHINSEFSLLNANLVESVGYHFYFY
jgi:hypothetical protein